MPAFQNWHVQTPPFLTHPTIGVISVCLRPLIMQPVFGKQPFSPRYVHPSSPNLRTKHIYTSQNLATRFNSFCFGQQIVYAPYSQSQFQSQFQSQLQSSPHKLANTTIATMQPDGRSMKRGRDDGSSVDLKELLAQFEALSIVVKEEIPAVLEAGVKVPQYFSQSAKNAKTRRVTFRCS